MRKTRQYIARFFVTAALLFCAAALHAAAPSCIIMPIEGDAPMMSSNLAAVRAELQRAVEESRRFSTWTIARTDQALVQQNFDAAAFKLPETAAATAGRLLKVDYVIYSELQFQQGRWLLSTGLLDVNGHRVVRHMRGRYTGSEQQVSRQAPRINIMQLLEMEDTHDAAAPLTAAGSPAQPYRPPAAPPAAQRPPPAVETGVAHSRPLREPPAPGRFSKRLDIGIRQPRPAPPVFISWLLLPALGIEINYNHAFETDIQQNDDLSAGKLAARSAGANIFLRYSDAFKTGGRRIPLRLQAGAGALLLLDTEFKGAGWWRNGFSADDRQAYSDWVAQGSPAWPNGGLQRSASTGDSVALNLDLCAGIGITESVFIDIYLQYINAKVDSEFVNTRLGTPLSAVDGSIRVNDLSAGLGLRYSF